MEALLIALTLTTINELNLPPCKYEDSRNCIWDASKRGNGKGQSFIDIDGKTIKINTKYFKVKIK